MQKQCKNLIPAVAASLILMLCSVARADSILVSVAPHIKDPITFTNLRVGNDQPYLPTNLLGEVAYPRSSCEDLQVSAELIGESDKVIKSVSIIVIPYRKGSVSAFKTRLPNEFMAGRGKTPPVIRKLSVFDVKCF